MPYKQRHRGQKSEDRILFNKANVYAIKQAVIDYMYLLDRRYSRDASLKLIGDRYKLKVRQRKVIQRIACSSLEIQYRKNTEVSVFDIKDRNISIDGYNLLITVESALSGAYLFRAADNCIRDIAAIHGTYKKVEETISAIEIIGKNLTQLCKKKVKWYLDSPVSNSGRLKMLLFNMAEKNHWDWDVLLIKNVDRTLAESNDVIITSDTWILNKVRYWTNFTAYLIARIDKVNLIDIFKLG